MEKEFLQTFSSELTQPHDALIKEVREKLSAVQDVRSNVPSAILTLNTSLLDLPVSLFFCRMQSSLYVLHYPLLVHSHHQLISLPLHINTSLSLTKSKPTCKRSWFPTQQCCAF